MAELARVAAAEIAINAQARGIAGSPDLIVQDLTLGAANLASGGVLAIGTGGHLRVQGAVRLTGRSGQGGLRSEEHTSELQSLMRISYAVFCLKKKKKEKKKT